VTLDKVRRELFKLEDSIKHDVLKGSKSEEAQIDLMPFFIKVVQTIKEIPKELHESALIPLAEELVIDPLTRLEVLKALEKTLVKPAECQYPKRQCDTCVSIAQAIGCDLPCIRFNPNIGALIDDARRELAINAIEKLLQGETLTPEEIERIKHFLEQEKAESSILLFTDFGEFQATKIMERPEKVKKWLENSLKRKSILGAKHRVKALGEIASAILFDAIAEKVGKKKIRKIALTSRNRTKKKRKLKSHVDFRD